MCRSGAGRPGDSLTLDESDRTSGSCEEVVDERLDDGVGDELVSRSHEALGEEVVALSIRRGQRAVELQQHGETHVVLVAGRVERLPSRNIVQALDPRELVHDASVAGREALDKGDLKIESQWHTQTQRRIGKDKPSCCESYPLFRDKFPRFGSGVWA